MEAKEKISKKMNLNSFINEFEKFSDRLKGVTDPVSEQELSEYLKSTKFSLPEEYLQLLSYSNGISLTGDEIYGIGPNCLGLSLEKAYHIEHDLVGNPMPKRLIPFAPDGYGNHYCFDSKDGSVYFWQHDLSRKRNLEEPVYSDLFEMIQEVFFDWTLQQFNYDGSEKHPYGDEED